MRLKDNEDGVSELVGFMLILLILMLFVSMLQVYEVPKWNKEIETGFFDHVYNDFIGLRSDIEFASARSIPVRSHIQLGVRYPERFLFVNPGPGASGSITFEPARITLRTNSGNFTMNSTRIIYKMNGISNQPDLIYEHGMIIQDFGNGNLITDSDQTLINGDYFSIPVIFSPPQSYGGLLSQNLNIEFLDASDYNMSFLPNNVNITLETKYPGFWNDLNISGIKVVNYSNSSGYIYINRSVNSLIVPNKRSDEYIISTILTDYVPDSLKPRGTLMAGTGSQGAYVDGKTGINLISIPPSSANPTFFISDVQSSSNCNKCITINIVDSITAFKIELSISGTTISGSSSPNACTLIGTIANGVDLTSCYKNATITIPNGLEITDANIGVAISYFKLTIY